LKFARQPQSVPLRPRSAGRIVAEVFGRREPPLLHRALPALIGAMIVHASLFLAARLSKPSLETWSAQMAARVHAELSREELIELDKPKPRTPPKPASVRRAPKAPRLARRASSAPTLPKTPAPPPPKSPAEAGKVVAQKPDPARPADLGDFDIVTGEGKAYAGGETSSTGKSKEAVHEPVAPGTKSKLEGTGSTGGSGTGDPKGEPDGGGPPPGPDRSRPVGVPRNWICRWPREAEDLAIDEQLVPIRVRVRADGTAASATLEQDPGNGFGTAAVACALQTRFTPARNRDGNPINSRPTLIRVRFTRT
jgi:protein TonB